MELFTQILQQNIPVRIPFDGRYFRILSGAGAFKLRTDTGVDTKYLSGLGVDLTHQGSAFSWLEITSLDKDQSVTGIISLYPVADSRLVGELGSGFNVSSLTIATGTSAELFPVNLNRKSISITIDQNLYVSGSDPADASGFQILAGNAAFNNIGALYAFNDSGFPCNVSILEEIV